MTTNTGEIRHVAANDNGFYWFTLNGEEDMFYRLGKQAQGLKKGMSVSFDYETSEREWKGKTYTNHDVDIKSIKEVEVSKEETTPAKGNGKWQGKGNYNKWSPENDMRIRYAGALNTATALVLFLVEHGHVKVGAKPKGKDDHGVLMGVKGLIHKVADDYFQSITEAPERDWTEEDAPEIIDASTVGEDAEDDGFSDD